jgi:hypothetical protein
MSLIEIRIGEKTYDVTPPFTNRELHLIKQIAGVRAGELFDAIEAGDNDVLVALAHIAVRRGDTARPSLDELWDLPAGEIVAEEIEDEPDPTNAADAAEPVGSPEIPPSEPGPPASEPSSTSAPAISAT